MPYAEAFVQLAHEQTYKAGQTFDTGKFIQNTSRWYPDVFSTDVVHKAASYFGGSSPQKNHASLWA